MGAAMRSHAAVLLPLLLLLLLAPLARAAEPSYFTRLWELDEATRRLKFAFTPYRTTYIMPFTSNSSPNSEVFREVDPERTLMRSEAVFQLSIKAKLGQDLFGGPVDLWLGYTQKAFWQLYDIEGSAPFRTIEHEAELIASLRTRFRLLGFDGRFLQVGLSHQSNGQARPLSRNWNRLVANVGLERGPFALLVTGWVRVLFDPGHNENPGITRQLGYGQVQGFWFHKRHRVGLMIRDNLNFRFNRAALQADWSCPLLARVGGFVQCFFGYGECLLDFDHRVGRVGAGIVLADWY
jgi:phospholipase A1